MPEAPAPSIAGVITGDAAVPARTNSTAWNTAALTVAARQHPLPAFGTAAGLGALRVVQ